MIAETRHQMILDILHKQRSASVQELAEQLHISESTIRRDLIVLDRQGKLTKVYGGAMAMDMESSYDPYEPDMDTKEGLYVEEKKRMGQYAASLIRADDFVYIDAGTSTIHLVNAIDGDAKKAVYVTNGLLHTRILARKGCIVYVPAGTEAIVGAAVLNSLRRYNFTKAFMGANGISIERGFMTPTIEEAELKAVAIQSSLESWFLADESKFNKICAAGICDLGQANIITNRLPDVRYAEKTLVKEIDRE